MITIPLRLERGVVYFVHTKKRQRIAYGVCRTGFPDLEDGLWRLCFQFVDELDFGIGERRHGLMLIENLNLDRICPAFVG
jgi:hypothetical protein